MPADFRSRRNVSMLDLFRASGYSRSEPIPEEKLEQYLQAHPGLVEDWLLESVDTRSSPAWYFMASKEHQNEWVVGLCPGTEIHSFTDSYAACAFYVTRYVDGLLTLKNKDRC
jgi:hypothetical protein